MPFYKKDTDYIHTAPNFVIAPNYELRVENKDTYTYPVDGWYWFDTLDAALSFFATPNDEISMRQCRLVLLANDLLSAVENTVSLADQATKIEWEYANTARRDSPLVSTLTAALGLSDAYVDSLFEQAKRL